MSPRRGAPPVPPLEVRQRPGLSVTLRYPRSIDTCQSCGLIADPSDGVALAKWSECDAWDRPAGTVVILCAPCSARLIDPHPRLYVRMQWWSPHAGIMELCHDCRFRGTRADALSCASPLAKRNGGPGVSIRYDHAPTWMHLNYGGGRGETLYDYRAPPVACSGFSTRYGRASCILCRLSFDVSNPDGHGLGECVTCCEYCDASGDNAAGEPCEACGGLGGVREPLREISNE